MAIVPYAAQPPFRLAQPDGSEHAYESARDLAIAVRREEEPIDFSITVQANFPRSMPSALTMTDDGNGGAPRRKPVCRSPTTPAVLLREAPCAAGSSGPSTVTSARRSGSRSPPSG